MTRRIALCIATLLLASGVAQAQLQEPTGFHAGFEYDAHAVFIRPSQNLTLADIARDAILTASKGSTVDMQVIGHADFDANGRAFELNISQRRADNAAAMLNTHIDAAIRLMQVPISVRARIRVSHKGIGTADPINAHPVTSDEHRANRRVTFKWVVTPVTP